jgi:hypothetical protein
VDHGNLTKGEKMNNQNQNRPQQGQLNTRPQGGPQSSAKQFSAKKTLGELQDYINAQLAQGYSVVSITDIGGNEALIIFEK